MKLFYLVSRLPYPIDKGDKLRAFHQLKIIGRKNDVILIALNDISKSKKYPTILDEYCSKIIVLPLSKITIVYNLLLGIFRSIPFQSSYFYSKKIRLIIEKEIKKHKPDLIFCQLIRMTEYVRNVKNVTKVVDFIDVLSLGLKRRIDNSNVLVALLVKIEYLRVRKYEKEVFNRFNGKLIISDEDRSHFPVENKKQIKVISNGVDINFFKPTDVDKSIDVVFIGNMGYLPNIYAAEFLVLKILPLVKKTIPNLKVAIVGSSPSRSVRILRNENVEVLSWVEDIRIYYSRSKIFVAPMLIGTGLQNKLLEAMAMGLPCITTTLAQKGLKNLGEDCLLIANSPKEFSIQIINLLSNPKLANERSIKGREYILKNYSWEYIANELNEVIETFEKERK